jgi:gamma-glutamyltranspeptidase/glutathione hydrolase
MRAAVLAAVVTAVLAAVPAGATQGTKFHQGTRGQLGVIATESPAAARVGRTVLEQGGNAVDAAVSTVFALGVARPQSCGIGGGGFMVIRSRTGAVRTLDFRETAPASIRADQFVNDQLAKEFTGHTTVGVPGVVAGMAAALKRYGTRPLAATIAPAQLLASAGFRVPTSLSGSMTANAKRLTKYPASAEQYLTPTGQAYAPGAILRQPKLAGTLLRLMRYGPNSFYRGRIGEQIVAEMGARGLITRADLAAYQAKWRAPLIGTYRGIEIDAMGPPTSGGIAILQMLKLLEGYDLKAAGAFSARAIHLTAEAQRIAWADRNAFVADPDFVKVPTATLTSAGYAAQRRAEIDESKTKSHAAGPLPPDANPTGSTTHVSVIDKRGAAVSVTCTIEQEFGSAVVVNEAGFLLNNEMTDFGAPGSANQPAPGKRPRSSMSPTIVVKDDQPFLVTGGAGGASIVMGVLETILDRIDFGMTLPQTVDAERFDTLGTSTLSIEDKRIPAAVLDDLRGRGWTIQPLGEYGPRPRVQIAGVELPAATRVAVSDSRSDQGSLAERLRPQLGGTAPTPPR